MSPSKKSKVPAVNQPHFFLLLILLLCAAAPLTNAQSQANPYRILTGPGPEDIVIDFWSGAARLLVSCAERRDNEAYGGIYAIDPVTNSTKQLRTSELPVPFWPHGIDIREINGHAYLYVVNHHEGARKNDWNHEVLIFQIQDDFLQLKEVLRDPSLRAPNDIHVLSDGSFYFSNWLKKQTNWQIISAGLFKRASGSIGYYDKSSGKFRIVQNRLKMPNGLVVQNNQLYVALTLGNRVRRYDITADGGLTRDKSCDFGKMVGGDNFFCDDNGDLYLTCHPSPYKFMRHSSNAQINSPFNVYRLRAAGCQRQLVYEDDGSNLSGGTVAVHWKNQLYVGQVFEAFVLQVDLP